jgi:hypothetical protein
MGENEEESTTLRFDYSCTRECDRWWRMVWRRDQTGEAATALLNEGGRQHQVGRLGPAWEKSLEKKTGCRHDLGRKAIWAPKIEFEIKQGFGVSKIKGFKYFETGFELG